MRRVVVAGYGMAGARFAEELRRREPDPERIALTVLGEESQRAYNRILLSTVVAGSMPEESVLLHDESWAQQHNVDLRLGVAAQRIDRSSRQVTLTDDSTVDYDALVLATGSRAFVPPIDGVRADDGDLADGVATFRTIDDCRRIVGRAKQGCLAVVLGGGLLGLEAARGLAGRGCRVTVVHLAGHLMERQLDPSGGRVLRGALEAMGIEFRMGTSVAGYLPGDGVKLSDGGYLPADLLVVSAGVRAETTLAAEAGLDVAQGVVIDDALRTSDARIHAIGDCASHPGTISGLVAPAWDQAAVLADLLSGVDPTARYRGTPVVTRLKAKGIDLAALGETQISVDAEDAEVVRVQDPARGLYAKLVLRGERVAGAIVLGAPDAAATITQLYDHGTPAPEDRLALLLGRALPEAAAVASSPAALPASSVICRCNTVSKADLVSAWRDGARSVDGLATATRATTGCGSCKDLVCGLADWLTSVDPA
ncbi:MAG TPA: FAD-dependent oxidoreductase [Pseudonocardiaceae bacterium]|jgi:assimilatory nitrate reductase electron transfer subunit|nr:FAD-dependent oxidoreductase [Pseudonocardiaceae bacterium]